jgi:SAM-dependent methyltransferase
VGPVPRSRANVDEATVAGFGAEWAAFDQLRLEGEQHQRYFDNYFGSFPFASLPKGAEGFDLGCGSGRWAALVAPRVGRLHCIDAAPEALEVARRRLAGQPNVEFHHAAADAMPLADGSQDFGYSLGVLHHIPDTRAALCDCVAKLKPGAPFLLYVYYALDNRPAWFRALWKASNGGRKAISRLPFRLRRAVTDAIAIGVYWPLARAARLAERAGANPDRLPLGFYRRSSLYTMRTDALDRFGTRLERRFTRAEVEAMMIDAGLEGIRVADGPPYWVAWGRKRAADQGEPDC